MPHDHAHHAEPLTRVNAAFLAGIALNLLFVLVEAVAGFVSGSLSLLADAGHNLADVGALALSLLGFQLMKVKGNSQFTYGYRKTSVLVALFNGVVLLASLGAISYEAVQRLFHPEPVPGITIAWVAGVGIVINSVTAFLFFRDKESDLNLKGAYLHLLSDALVSVGIVIGGVAIVFSGWFWLDSALSLAVALVILFGTWKLLAESLRLSLDGVPGDIQLDSLRSAVLKVEGVKDLHHIHVWALSTTENALTAHLVLAKNTTPQEERNIKHELRHELEHQKIQHVTLETERENEPCESGDCEP